MASSGHAQHDEQGIDGRLLLGGGAGQPNINGERISVVSGSFVRSQVSKSRLSRASVSRAVEDSEAAGQAVAAQEITDPRYWRMYYWLPFLHFVVGFFNCLSGTAWQKAQIGAVWYINPAEQTLLGGVIGSLPWNLKIFVALMSDVVPIFGRRRRPYLILGSVVQGLSFLALGFFGGPNMVGMFGTPLGFAALSAQQFCSTFGQMMIGVMCDTLIVENMRYEIEAGGKVGMIMTNCQMWFTAGGLAGQLLSGFLPQTLHVPLLTIFMITGFGKLSIVVLAIFMSDPVYSSAERFCKRFKSTTGDIWDTMKMVRVLSPLVFIIVFAMTPNSSQSFNSYLMQAHPLCEYSSSTSSCDTRVFGDNGLPVPAAKWFCGNITGTEACDREWGGLKFSDIQYSLMGTLGSVGSFLGMLIFQRWFINTGWHKLVTAVVFIATVAALLQLVLMFRDPVTGLTINERLHIPNIFFALGDDVIMTVTNQLLAMPISILMAKLCPEGAEGTVYALTTSLQMVSGMIGNLIAENLTSALNVTNINFHNLWRLTTITSTAKLVCLFFLPLVPANIDANASNRRHVCCGVALLSFFAFGLIWAFVQIALKLFHL